MTPFTKRVITIIQSIPEGAVMTYGGIARAAGSPRGARQVVRILHSMSRKYKLPWHRVINSKGMISLTEDESGSLQQLYLLGEGIIFDERGVIDLERYQYDPGPALELELEPEQDFNPDPEDHLLPPFE
ncbi:DNA methyltransferase [Paenibacillus sp. LMG 31459]|uniref:DNA methyltransferase n=1 Tax=Paenibacillus phytohabitans TaxID=2654978 RepID=A0ABX1YNA1_9BACL|nr:MGMT family protein [Paenibacillus phytohabitans]NOU82331.1 DNA methyltransferase [Paenibacillus phytohabitans]